MTNAIDREIQVHRGDLLDLDGLGFIEYTTSRPQALSQVLEMMGFHLASRHRSRRVLLYRQEGDKCGHQCPRQRRPRIVAPGDKPVIFAVVSPVRDAVAAHERTPDLGAWAVPTNVEVTEVNILAIYGVGSGRISISRALRLDRQPRADSRPRGPSPANAGRAALVRDRTVRQSYGMDNWWVIYREVFGFVQLPDDESFGVTPYGRILANPCTSVYLQLVDPAPAVIDFESGEMMLQRICPWGAQPAGSDGSAARPWNRLPGKRHCPQQRARSPRAAMAGWRDVRTGP